MDSTSGKPFIPFQVIGHRGAAGHAPENTRASFEAALTLGVDAIETDLHLSKDGRAVVIHDATVDRTTNGIGAVNMLDGAEIKSLDAGSWFDPCFTGEPILFLDEALDLIGDRVPVVLEIKERERTSELLSVVRDHIHGRSSRVLISSFSLDTLELAKEIMPDIPMGWLISRGRHSVDEAVEMAGRLGLHQVCPNAEDVDAHWIERARDAGLGIRAWGIPGDHPSRMVKSMRHLIRIGVDGATADYPDVLRSVTLLTRG